MNSWGVLTFVVVLTTPATAQAETLQVASTAEGPWEQSVALERAGDMHGAEAVMVAAWGKKPDNFYAQMRLAYLALVTNRASAAVARYARARRFPEAENDADAVTGYAAALALKGWQLADAGRSSKARAYWQKALAIKADQADALAGLDHPTMTITEPEVWGAMVGQSIGSGRYQGLAVFAQIPWRFFDRLALRVAGRHIEWRQVASPLPTSTQSSVGWNVNELYVAAGYDTTLVTAEALGFGVTWPGASAITGTGMRLRVGRRWGASAELAALRTNGQWVNEQVRPVAFLMVDPHLVVHAGARFTHEANGNRASGVAGALLLGGPFVVYLQGHLGGEHWAANLIGPSLLSITPRTRMGANLTVLWNATRALRVAAQGEAYALETDNATGAFWSVSLGVQLRIFSL